MKLCSACQRDPDPRGPSACASCRALAESLKAGFVFQPHAPLVVSQARPAHDWQAARKLALSWAQRPDGSTANRDNAINEERMALDVLDAIDEIERLRTERQQLREEIGALRYAPVPPPDITEADLDKAIGDAELHAGEYGELQRAVDLLRLLKQLRARSLAERTAGDLRKGDPHKADFEHGVDKPFKVESFTVPDSGVKHAKPVRVFIDGDVLVQEFEIVGGPREGEILTLKTKMVKP